MSTPLTPEAVAARLLSYPHDTYLYVGSFMRSVALAAGALVLLEILSHKRYWWRLLPWVACLLATIITLMTWGRGVLLTNSKSNIWDAILPLLMGISEFCLFAILSPKEYWHPATPVRAMQEDDELGSWRYWLFVHAIHALLAVGLVANRLAQTDPVLDFDGRLRPLALEYVGWMKEDLRGAAFGTVIFSLLGLLTLYLAKREKRAHKKRYVRIVAALSLVPIIIYSMVTYQAGKQRDRTDEFVSTTK